MDCIYYSLYEVMCCKQLLSFIDIYFYHGPGSMKEHTILQRSSQIKRVILCHCITQNKQMPAVCLEAVAFCEQIFLLMTFSTSSQENLLKDENLTSVTQMITHNLKYMAATAKA